jgi:excisionase family DNA binding protein
MRAAGSSRSIRIDRESLLQLGPTLDVGYVMTRQSITIAEAADYLQISDRTVRRLIADGELTGYRMGRSRRVIRVDLN